MRIDGKLTPGMESVDQATRKNGVEKRGGESLKSGALQNQTGSDAVVISGRAKEAASLTKTLKELPDVREDKVSELKARVANGSYSVSGGAIAEKIVSASLTDLF